MYENRGEGAPQPDGSHVTTVQRDVRVQPPAQGKHRLGDIHRGGVEVGRQVGKVVPDPELENRMPAPAEFLAQHGPPVRRLFGVFPGGLISGIMNARSL